MRFAGVQHFSYGAMGEIIQNIHTFVLPQHHTYTLQMNFAYDSWNPPSAPLRERPTPHYSHCSSHSCSTPPGSWGHAGAVNPRIP
ncbi:MAG TPA: hypothetical protein P5228_12540 [Bacteroidales bacterium]|nr:hypothetical protein [Bacteroidales bacterium]HRZ49448.1 hypothetical protein [Bacteroidales bacterium]